MSYMGIQELKDADLKSGSATGDGSTTTFAIGWTPPSEQSLFVTINGVLQSASALSLSGANCVFTAAPASGDAIEFKGIQSSGTVVTTTGDGTIDAAKLADNAVTSVKIIDDAVTEPKLNTTGTASASTYLSGTMVWTAVAGTSVTTTKTTGTTTLTDSDASGYVVVPCDSSGGNVIIKLPAAASAWSGSVLHIIASAAPGATYNVAIQNSGGTELAQLNKKGDYYIVTCDSAGSNLVVIDQQQTYSGWLLSTTTQGSMAHSLGTVKLFTNTSDYSIGYNYGNWWDSANDKLTVPSGWTGRIYLNLNIGLRADGYVAGSVYKDGASLKIPVIYLAAGAPQPFEWNEAVTGGEYYEPYGYNTYTSSTRSIEDGVVFQWTAERDI